VNGNVCDISRRNTGESFKYFREKDYLGDKKMNASELRIEKKEYGVRLVIGDESYFIKDGGKQGWFELVVETPDGEIKDVIDDEYENLGVRNLEELVCKLISNPSKVLEMLLGEKKEIDSIIIKF